MPTLYHPVLGRDHNFPSDRSARLARRSGWVDPPGPGTNDDPDDSAAAEFLHDINPQQEENTWRA